jgi:predicted house-cleaning noncanonical NTP pyrophosphatase (MazG superfamily)
MSQTGQPARTATSDANANFVNPPAVKSAGRTATSTSIRVASDTEQAAQNLGSSLGKAFHSVLKDKATNINARREMAGANAQGNAAAISDINKDKQRGGWAEAIWGQNPEWRGIQQRAVTNNIMQMQLEQSNRISEYAAEDSVTYGNRLTSQLEEQLKKYPNDKETQQLITSNWAKASEMLSKQQAKEHYGHSLMQAQEVSYNGIATKLDMFNLQAQNITNEDGAVELTNKAKSFFSMGDLPAGQTKQAYRADIGRALEANLEQGNIGAYNMAKENGFFDNYNEAEGKKLNAAVKRYDTRATARVNLTVAQSKNAIMKAKTTDEVDAIMAEAIQVLDDHEGRSSGTDAFALSVENARYTIQTMKAPAIEAAIKREVEFEKREEQMEAILRGEQDIMQRSLDVIDAVEESKQSKVGKLLNLGPIKPEEITAAHTEIERNIVASATGIEDITVGDVPKEVLGNPDIAAQVVSHWESTDGSSKLLSTMATAYMNGFSSTTMVNEDHQPTEVARNTMATLAQFESADLGKFMDTLGPDGYENYLIIKDGQLTGKTSDMIQEELTKVAEADSNMDDYAPRWSDVITEKNKTPRDYVGEIYGKVTGESVYGENIGNLMTIYKRGLRQGKGDHSAAKDYLTTRIKDKSRVIHGNVVYNVDKVGLSELKFPNFMKAMEAPDNNLMAGQIAIAMGNTENEAGNIITSLDSPELRKTLKIEVSPEGGVWVRSKKFLQPIYMSPEKLQAYEGIILQNENDKTLQREIEKESQRKQNDMDNTLGFSRKH